MRPTDPRCPASNDPRPATPSDAGRRHFLVLAAGAGGGLLVGCSPSDPRARGQAQAPAGQAAAAQEGAALNAWVRIAPDGRVTVAVPRAEMGQGVHTSLAQLVAEELEADWSLVRAEHPQPNRAYANTAVLKAVLPLQPDDEGWLARAARWSMEQAGMALSLNITGGSTSVRAAWEPMRWAGASARAVLEATAARHWGVKPAECRALQGQVRHEASGRQMGFGEAAARWVTQPISPASDLSLKPRERWTLIGTSPTRLDTPAKSRGQAPFGADLQLPGLKRAALRICPYLGGRLIRVDEQAARALRGVHAVHVFDEWSIPAVAVVADTTWQALRAAQALKIEWDAGLGTTLSDEQMRQALQDQLEDGDTTTFRSTGQAEERLRQASHRLDEQYEVPPLAHAPMETLNATARFQNGRLELWTGTQVPILARWRASQIAGISIDDVILHVPFLGGGFGRRLEVDVVEQVTRLAMKMPGTPVQLLWTREQDLRHDMVRPPALARLQASLEGGRLQALHIRVCAPSLSDGTFRRLFPPALTDPLPAMPDKVQIEGAFDLPYAVDHQQVEQVLAPSPLAIGSWRSVGHSHNAFFTECFMDEVADALKKDPVQLRRELLKHRPRHLAVLEAAARLAQWGRTPPAGRALGIALHECFGSICAQVAEVSLQQGRPRVHRIFCALDAGTLIHPDTVKAQLEGAIVFGLSAALWGRVPVHQGEVMLKGWSDYPVVRMADMPEILTTLMASKAEPGGVGEPGTPPVAPAVVNALARLDGQRRRRLPLIPASV